MHEVTRRCALSRRYDSLIERCPLWRNRIPGVTANGEAVLRLSCAEVDALGRNRNSGMITPRLTMRRSTPCQTEPLGPPVVCSLTGVALRPLDAARRLVGEVWDRTPSSIQAT